VVTKNDKIAATDDRTRRGRASALNAPRRRVHPLAPEHVGELGSVAALVVAVLGIALIIVGLTFVVTGLTMAGRYAGTEAPPNVNQLGQLPLFGGIGITLLGVLLAAAPIALLADIRRARIVTVVVAVAAALLALAGLLVVISRVGSDPIVTAALGLMALLLGASALVLARPGR
jgi:hypothetical protein